MTSFFTTRIINMNANFLVGISFLAMNIPPYQRPPICLFTKVQKNSLGAGYSSLML